MSEKSSVDEWEAENESYHNLDPLAQKNAKTIAKAINVFSVVLGLSFLFYPLYYKLQLALILVLPWIAFYLVYKSEGHLRVLSFKESLFPGFSTTLLFSFWLVIVRSIMDYTILDYTNVWWLTFAVAPILTWLFLKMFKREFKLDFESKPARLILLGCFGLVFSLYTFFVAIMINCTFDSSGCQIIESVVVTKNTNRFRKMRHYSVQVEVPKKYGDIESVRMTRDRWNQIAEGDEVELGIRQGLLGIEWVEMYELN
jgi:hypothetical protein